MIYLLFLLMLMVVVVLIIGLTVLIKGGEVNKKYGNKMMQARIAFQFLAVLVGLAILIIAGKH